MERIQELHEAINELVNTHGLKEVILMLETQCFDSENLVAADMLHIASQSIIDINSEFKTELKLLR